MNKILPIITLFQGIYGLTYWFDIEPSPSKLVQKTTIAGPNEEYVVQGSDTEYRTLRINWEDQTSAELKTITLPSTGPTQLSAGVRLTGNWGNSVVFNSKTIWRANINPNDPTDVELYPVIEGDNYGELTTLRNTVYIFTGRANGTPIRFYRLSSDTTADIKQFPVNYASRAHAVLYGTPWLIVSKLNANQRVLYDYTNGYSGGSNQAT